MSALLVVACSNGLFVDSREITHGGIDGFAIGMTKQRVLAQAREHGVQSIRPEVNFAPSVDYASVDDLSAPGSGRALGVFDGSDRVAVLVFDQGMVSEVRAGASDGDRWLRLRGMTTTMAIASLKNAMTRNHALTVRELVNSPNNAWFVLADSIPGRASPVLAYDIWSFEAGGKIPHQVDYTIYFSEGRVVRISYMRPRIRVE